MIRRTEAAGPLVTDDPPAGRVILRSPPTLRVVLDCRLGLPEYVRTSTGCAYVVL